MPQTFAQVYDLYRNVAPPTMSLPQFSRYANQVSGTREFDEGDRGLVGRLFGQADYWTDELLNKSGLPEQTGRLGQKAFEMFGGTPSAGYEAGHSLPRQAINFAPMMLAAPETGGASLLPMLTSAGLVGAEAYGKTGDPIQGLTSAATVPLMAEGGKFMAGAAESAGLIKTFDSVPESVMGKLMGQKLLMDLPSKVANYVAHNLGAIGTGEATSYALDAFRAGTINPWAGQGWDRLLGSTLGNLPWMLTGLPGVMTPGPVPFEPKKLIQSTRPENKLEVPTSVTPEDATQAGLLLNKQMDLRQASQIVDPVARDRAVRMAQYQLEMIKGKSPSDVHGELPDTTPSSLWTDEMQPVHDAFARMNEAKSNFLREKYQFSPTQEAPHPSPEMEDDWSAYFQNAADPEHELRAALQAVPQATVEALNSPEVLAMHLADVAKLAEVANVPPEPTARMQEQTETLLKANIAPTPDEASTATVVEVKNRKLEEAKKKVAKIEAERVAKATIKLEDETRNADLIETDKTSSDALLSSAAWKATGLINNASKAGNNPTEAIRRAKKAYQKWRDEYVGGKMEGDPLARLEGAIKKTVYRANIPDFRGNAYRQPGTDKPMYFNSPEEAQQYANDLNAKLTDLDQEVIREYAKGTSNGKHVVQPKYVSEQAKAETEKVFRKKADEMLAKATRDADEAERVKAKLSEKTSDPDKRLAQMTLEDVVNEFAGDIHETGISSKKVLEGLKASGMTPEDAKRVLENKFAKSREDADEAWRPVINEHEGEASAALRAGPGLHWSLPEVAKVGNNWTLGGKQIGREGLMDIAGLKSIGKLKDAEIKLYQQLVPEAFEGAKVNVTKLVAGLEKNGPVVEERKLSEGSQTQAQKDFAKIRHEFYDTLAPNIQRAVQTHGLAYWTETNAKPEYQTPEFLANVKRYQELNDAISQTGDMHQDAQYAFVAPKAESEMPGYVEGLVRVPHGATLEEMQTDKGRAKADPLFRGPHFGSEDTNVVSFYRGFEDVVPEDHPNVEARGKKVFHVIEIQYDWLKKQLDGTFRVGNDPTVYKTRVEAEEAAKKLHPLFNQELANSLALKAALKHAKEIGADYIALSDAETAMMSEGHDAYATTANEHRDASIIPQEKGMRLHYDRTLPSELKRLTGDAGSEVGFGVHEKAKESSPAPHRLAATNINTGEIRPFPTWAQVQDFVATHGESWRAEENIEPGKVKGSPVFRDASGAPKSSITARMFDISSLKDKDSFPLFGAIKPEHMTTLESLVHAYDTGAPLTDAHKDFLREYYGLPDAATDKDYLTRARDLVTNMTDERKLALGNEPLKRFGIHVQEPDQVMPSLRDAAGRILRKSGVNGPTADHYADNLASLVEWLGVPRMELGMMHDPQNVMDALGLGDMGTQNIAWLNTAYGNIGAGEKIMNLQSVLLHEVGGHMIDKAHQQGLLKGTKVEKSIEKLKEFVQDPKKAFGFMQILHSLLPKTYQKAELWKATFGDKGYEYYSKPDELFANIMAMTALIKMQKSEPHGLLMAPEPRKFIKEMKVESRKLIGALKGMTWLHEGEVTSGFHSAAQAIGELFDETIDTMRNDDRMLARQDKMMELAGPDAYRQQIFLLTKAHIVDMSDLAGARTNHGIELEGPAEKLVKDVLAPMSSMYTNPATAQLADPVFRHYTDTSAMQNALFAPFAGGQNPDTGAVSFRTEQAKSYERLQKGSNLPLSRDFSELAQWIQEYAIDKPWSMQMLKDSPNRMWPPTGNKRRDMYEVINRRSDQDKRDIEHGLAAQRESMKTLSRLMTETENEKSRYLMASGFTSIMGGDHWAKGPDFALKMQDAMQMASDPVQMAMGQQKLAQLRQGLISIDPIKGEAAFDLGMKTWMLNKEKVDELSQFWATRPNFWSNMRAGKWHVHAFDKNGQQVKADNFANLDDIESWKKAVREEHGNDVKFSPAKQTKGNVNTNWQNDESLAMLQTADDKFKRGLQALEMPDELRAKINDMLDATSLTASIHQMINAKDPSTPGPGEQGARRNVPGYHDVLTSQDIYRGLAARMFATRKLRARLDYARMNPRLDDVPDSVKRFKHMLTNYMTPDTPLTSGVGKLNGVYYMGLNIPTAMVQPMDLLMSVYPEMIAQGIDPVKAAKMMGLAALKMGKYSYHLLKESVGLTQDHLAIAKMGDKDEAALFRYANDEGIIPFGHANDMFDKTADATIDLHTLSQRGALPKAITKAKSAIADTANFSLKAFTAAEHYNKRTALLIGHMIAKEKMGTDYNQADAHLMAAQFMRQSTFAVGKANRTVMHGDTGPIGAAAYGLSSYTLGSLFQLARYVKQWRGNEYLGLTPAERSAAGKAALTSLGMKFAAAGVLGMPFVGIALKLVEKLTDKDIEANLWEDMGKMLEEDKREMGGGLTDVIMTGAANAMLANSGMPVDVASRMSSNGILGFSNYDGYSADGVFGPTGGMVSSALAGLRSAQAGRLSEAVGKVSPPAIRRAIKYLMNGEQVESASGQVFPVSQGEGRAYMLGFDPQRLAKLNRYHGVQAQVDDSLQADHQREATDVLTALQADPLDARQKILQISNDTGEDRRLIAQRVAKTAADKVFPEDIRANLNKQTQEHLMQVAKLMNVPLVQAAQVARSQYMQNVMEALGVRPQRTPQMAESWDQTTGYSPFAPSPRSSR